MHQLQDALKKHSCQWLMCGTKSAKTIRRLKDFKKSTDKLKLPALHELSIGVQLIGTLNGIKVYLSDVQPPDEILMGWRGKDPALQSAEQRALRKRYPNYPYLD